MTQYKPSSAPNTFLFNATTTTEIYTLSLHDALPISASGDAEDARRRSLGRVARGTAPGREVGRRAHATLPRSRDRKSTRLNSSHSQISYAVFCLKKKNQNNTSHTTAATRQHAR